MNQQALPKITAPTAAELCAHFELEEAAQPLLTATATPQQFLDALIEAGHQRDAVQFLAHALPAREAVWWACVCARSITTADSPPPAVASLQAAEAWAYEPTEENRRAAEAAAQEEGLEHPASWAAQAAFWSSGSLSPAGNPEVPPGPFLTAKAVAATLLLAAVVPPPEHATARFQSFLEQGRGIAAG